MQMPSELTSSASPMANSQIKKQRLPFLPQAQGNVGLPHSLHGVRALLAAGHRCRLISTIVSSFKICSAYSGTNYGGK